MNATDGSFPERDVAVFDLDGTLLRGDTTAEFVRGLIVRSPARVAVAFAPVLGPLFFVPFARRYAITLLLWIATVGPPAITPGRAGPVEVTLG